MSTTLSLLVLALASGSALAAGTPKDSKPATLLHTFKIPGHDSARSVQFSPDGTRVACAGWSQFVGVWDLKTGAELLKLTKTGNEWTRLTFSPDGKHLVLGDFNGVVKILDAASGKAQGTLAGHAGIINLVVFLDDKKTVVTADSNGKVCFWDFPNHKKLPDRDLALGEGAHPAITPDGKTLVSARYEKDGMLLEVWDTASRKKTATIDGGARGILAIAVAPDGKTAFSSARDEAGFLWDLKGKKARGTLVGHKREIFAFAVTADGKTVITGSTDELVKLWDAATGGERLTLAGRGGMIMSLAVAAGGDLVAAGRGDEVSVWRLTRTASAFPAQVARAPGKGRKEKHDKDNDGQPDKEAVLINEQAEQLAEKGLKGVLALAEKVKGDSPKWKSAALVSLRRLGSEAAPALDALIGELKTGDSAFKSLCLEIVAAIGPKAKSALPAIIAAADDTSDFEGVFRKGGPSNTAEAALRAVKAIDPDSMPRLARTMLPGLMKVFEGGRQGPMQNALALLRELGPHARPALPKLRDRIAEMPNGLLRDVFPVFLAAGEDGMTLLADYMLDPKTPSETRLALMRGYRWERTTTPSTIRMLRAVLKDKSPEVRVAGLQSLESVRAKELLPDLVPLLSDFDILDVRSDFRGDDPFHAARALGNQGELAVAHLIKGLDHKVPLARYQAAYALARIGKDALPARAALEKLLDDAVPVIQLEAAKALLAQGKPHEQALAKIAGHLRADDKLLGDALRAANSLGRAGRPLFPAVKKLALEATQYPVQRHSFDALRKLGGDGKELVQVWAKLAQQNPAFLGFPPEDAIRANAKEVQKALPGLLKHLDNRDVNVRRRLMEVLTLLGPAARDALPALIKTLEDDAFPASGAVDALGAMGPEAKPAVKALVKRYEDVKAGEATGKAREGDYDRSKILAALEKIGPGAVDAIPMLLKYLPDQPRAARVLGKIGPAAREGVVALEKMRRDGTTYEKTAAAFALLRITEKQEPYLGELTETLRKSKAADVRLHIIEVLGDLGADARPALPVLLAILKEKSNQQEESFGASDLREPTAAALASFGPDARDAVPDLIDMVQNSYYRARITAANTLAAIGPDAKAAIPALERMAREDERFVSVVENALAKLRAKS